MKNKFQLSNINLLENVGYLNKMLINKFIIFNMNNVFL